MSVKTINPDQKSNRRFTPQLKIHILREWQRTGNSLKVAEKYQISRDYLYQWRKAKEKGEYLFEQQRNRVNTRLLAMQSSNGSLIKLYEENRRLRKLKSAVFLWMLNIMQENVSFSTIRNHLACKLTQKDLQSIYVSCFNTPRYVRKKALVILFHLYGISVPVIAEFLFLSPKAVKRYIRRFKKVFPNSYDASAKDRRSMRM